MSQGGNQESYYGVAEMFQEINGRWLQVPAFCNSVDFLVNVSSHVSAWKSSTTIVRDGVVRVLRNLIVLRWLRIDVRMNVWGHVWGILRTWLRIDVRIVILFHHVMR